MKTKLLYIIIAFVLTSCNQEKEHLKFAQMKADEFVHNYASEFLKNNELLIYNYHPRAQFTSNQDSLNVYRVFPRKEEVRLICFSDTCELPESFNNQPLILSKGSYTLKNDSIIYELTYDSTIARLHTFKSSPILYFDNLKDRLENYGVFAYSLSEDKSFIKVFLTVQYYLIQTEEIKDRIFSDQIIKSYNDDWYFVKMERPMDLG